MLKRPGTSIRFRTAFLTIVACAALLGAVFGLVNALSLDFAIVALVTYLCTFIATISFLVWAVGRKLAWTLVVCGLVAFFTFVEVEGVTGDLWLRWKWRFARYRDELLEVPETNLAASFAAPSPFDFPGYLGPDRDGSVDSVTLSEKWGSEPDVVWRKAVGAGWSAFAAVNGFAFTMEQRGDQELVTCYRLENGELVWTNGVATRHGDWSKMSLGVRAHSKLGGIGPRATPQVHQGRVFALGATGVLRCLDFESGDTVWQKDLLERVEIDAKRDLDFVRWARSNSPLIVDDMVVVPLGGDEGKRHSLIAFDAKSGDEKWVGGSRQISYSSPTLLTLAGVRQIVCVNEASVSGHRIEDGRVLWEHEWDGSSGAEANTSQPHLIGSDQLLVTKGYSGGAALLKLNNKDKDLEAELLWHRKTSLRTKMTSAVVFEGHAYGLSNGILECVELESGRKRWKKGRYGHGQILRVGRHLLVIEEFGTLRLLRLDPRKHTEIQAWPKILTGECWNTLCLTRDLLLVRSDEEAVCIRLPLKD